MTSHHQPIRGAFMDGIVNTTVMCNFRAQRQITSTFLGQLVHQTMIFIQDYIPIVVVGRL